MFQLKRRIKSNREQACDSALREANYAYWQIIVLPKLVLGVILGAIILLSIYVYVTYKRQKVLQPTIQQYWIKIPQTGYHYILVDGFEIAVSNNKLVTIEQLQIDLNALEGIHLSSDGTMGWYTIYEGLIPAARLSVNYLTGETEVDPND